MKPTLKIAALGFAAVLAWAACSNPHLAGGKLHFDQERFDRAEENFQLAVEKDPSNGEAWMWLAMSQAEQNRPEEAAANFTKAAELAPRIAGDIENNRMSYYADAYNSGLTYSTQAQEAKDAGDEATAQESFRKALTEFNKAVIYRADEPEAWMSIGKSHFNLGNIDSALVNFDHAHSIDPTNEKVNTTLYEVYKVQGNQAFGTGIDAKQAGDDAKAKELFEAALKFYDSAAELGSDDLDLVQNRAGIEWELADLDPARKDELNAAATADYEKVLAAEPENAVVLENLAMLESSRGNKEAALDYATRLVDLDPKNASSHIMQGRAQGALDNSKAMLGDLLIGQSLDSGTQVPPSQARTEAEKHGTRSDMLSQLRASGEPEEIRTYSDTGGSEYQIWFYWTRGRAYCYQNGDEIYAKEFKGVTETSGSGGSGE